MELATSSLPVPLSPRIRTVAEEDETWEIIWRTSRILLEFPIILVKLYLFSNSDFSRIFSVLSCSFSTRMFSMLMTWWATMVATTESSFSPFFKDCFPS